MNKKKILCVASAVLLLLCLLGSCASKVPIETTDESSVTVVDAETYEEKLSEAVNEKKK